MKYVENSEPKESFKLWTGISVIAAVLQRKCSLPWGDPVYPNMYIVLVGPSGSRKGTAMSPGYRMLSEMGIKLAAEATTREALIRNLKQSTNTQVSPDGGSIYIHSSLTIFSKELTVFLGYNNQNLMADLCDWFDCGDTWKYETISRGIDQVSGVWVNLIGATTPSLLQTTLPRDAIGGGLTARMILIFEERKGKMVIAPFYTTAEAELRKKLVSDLEKISMLSGEFKVTEEFLLGWANWYTNTEKSPPFKGDDRLSAYVDRRPIHMLKLSMILNASRSDKMLLDAEDLARADQLLHQAEIKMKYAFTGVGRSKTADVLTKVWSIVAMEHQIKMSDIMRQFYYDVDREEMAKILHTLESMKVISIDSTKRDPLIVYIGKGEAYEQG